MAELALRAIFLLALPLVAVLGGGYLLEQLSRRQDVDQKLFDFAQHHQELGPKFKQGLGMRFGYSVAEVNQRWSALDSQLKFERLSLEIDLVFPFVYGGAFATALLLTWAALGRPFPPILIMAPVAIAVLADWTENLIQLGQLKLFNAAKPDGGLDSTMIQLASVATMTKLIFLSGSFLFLVVLVFRVTALGLKR